MPCTRDHDGDLPRAVGALDDSHDGFWNHKCAGCAYEMGRADAALSEDRLRAQVRELEAKLVELERQHAPPRTAAGTFNGRRPAR
jgi:hypothetical protein